MENERSGPLSGRGGPEDLDQVPCGSNLFVVVALAAIGVLFLVGRPGSCS